MSMCPQFLLWLPAHKTFKSKWPLCIRAGFFVDMQADPTYTSPLRRLLPVTSGMQMCAIFAMQDVSRTHALFPAMVKIVQQHCQGS